jgi:hypothetical protein
MLTTMHTSWSRGGVEYPSAEAFCEQLRAAGNPVPRLKEVNGFVFDAGGFVPGISGELLLAPSDLDVSHIVINGAAQRAKELGDARPLEALCTGEAHLAQASAADSAKALSGYLDCPEYAWRIDDSGPDVEFVDRRARELRTIAEAANAVIALLAGGDVHRAAGRLVLRGAS